MRRLSVLLLFLLLAAPSARAAVPNDPGWSLQWAQRLMRLPAVWDLTTGDPSVVIATIDTGARELSDLQGAFVPGWDFVDGDANTWDEHGHGTWVASVIAARTNNGTGIAGVCGRCRVMPVRVASGGSADPARVADGIYWAVDHGARVINVSLNRPGPPDPQESAAIQYAFNRGVLVIASAGNSGTDAPRYPAAYPGVLAVTATDELDLLYPWSTRGVWVPLAAPGCYIVIDPLLGGPGRLCGTSLGPAAVAGIAGLMFSLKPELTVEQVMWIMRTTSVPVAGIAGGRVDAHRAVAALGLLPDSPPETTQPPQTTTQTPQQPSRPRGQPRVRYARQVQVENGTLRRTRSFVMRMGAGPARLRLESPLAHECTIGLRSQREAVVGTRNGHRSTVTLATRVRTDLYAVEIRCVSGRPKPYALSITARLPDL
jgi:subtilisin family serine protease